jgi:hypothetical protein
MTRARPGGRGASIPTDRRLDTACVHFFLKNVTIFTC